MRELSLNEMNMVNGALGGSASASVDLGGGISTNVLQVAAGSALAYYTSAEVAKLALFAAAGTAAGPLAAAACFITGYVATPWAISLADKHLAPAAAA